MDWAISAVSERMARVLRQDHAQLALGLVEPPLLQQQLGAQDQGLWVVNGHSLRYWRTSSYAPPWLA
jgi:hypothetical protein